MGHETGAYIAHHTTLLGHNNQWDWRKNAHIKKIKFNYTTLLGHNNNLRNAETILGF